MDCEYKLCTLIRVSECTCMKLRAVSIAFRLFNMNFIYIMRARILGKALGVDANARKDAVVPRQKLIHISQYKPIMLTYTDCMYSIC